MKTKKAQMNELLKIILWIVFFLIAGLAISFIIKKIGG